MSEHTDCHRGIPCVRPRVLLLHLFQCKIFVLDVFLVRPACWTLSLELHSHVLNLHLPLVLRLDGTLSHYKARLVANGSTQLLVIDVGETFSSVVKSGTIQTVLGLAISRHWPVHQMDIKNVFLHRDLSKTQASRAWFQRFAAYITRVGFSHSHCDASLFIYRYGTTTAYLLLYVDDIVLTAAFEHLLQQIIDFLHHEFSMTDLRKYATKILERVNMASCNPSRTPIDTESKLGADGAIVSNLTLYRSLVGSLQYLIFTRPDISYAVQQVCLYMHDHQDPHFLALKRIFRYVRGNNLLSWSSKRQPTLGRSSADAEYRGVANAVAETRWLRNLLCKLHTPLSSATLVYCDNVRVLHVPSRYQFADIFTKGLLSNLFEEFRFSLSIRCPSAQTAGEFLPQRSKVTKWRIDGKRPLCPYGLIQVLVKGVFRTDLENVIEVVDLSFLVVDHLRMLSDDSFDEISMKSVLSIFLGGFCVEELALDAMRVMIKEEI
ncbi:ribonuclease H-like domain-containing protein [Tanacetum coccineum]